MAAKKSKKKKPKGSIESTYAIHKRRARDRNRKQTEDSQDIGELPKVADLHRREAGKSNLRLFLQMKFPGIFFLPFSPDQITYVDRLQNAILHGGLIAIALPRGGGKTTIALCAVLWAILYGHRRFIVLIGADKEKAKELLEAIRSELENNGELYDDFPEVCVPIRALEGVNQRRLRYQGERIHMKFTANLMVLPNLEGAPSSSAIVKTAGLTGAVRGMNYKTPDGQMIRPDFVIPDDPQTDTSARSVSQCRTRKAIINGAILGLAGPGQKIAGVMPCTCIRPGDVAHEFLDRSKHPEWNGERTKLLNSFPTNMELWDKYADLRADGMEAGDEGAAATEFYGQHRAEMDAGAEASWAERFNPDELSAIQNAMNLFYRDREAFFSEYQNDPLPEEEDADAEVVEIGTDEILKKVNGLPRGRVPMQCQHVTAFVDVHQGLLYWVVCAWEENFTGYVIDYGTFPDQQLSYFTLRQAKRTLKTEAAKAGIRGGEEAVIRWGLDQITNQLCGREWTREDDSALVISRCLQDSGWKSDVVSPFVRQSSHRAVLFPSKGRGYKASENPLLLGKKLPGELRGRGVPWRLLRPYAGDLVRRVEFDTNWFKSFVVARLRVSLGGRGALSIFGENRNSHRCFAEHLSSEKATRVRARGNVVDEWKLRPARENHWLDCLVGCTVAAAMQGVTLSEQSVVVKKKPRRNRVMSMGI